MGNRLDDLVYCDLVRKNVVREIRNAIRYVPYSAVGRVDEEKMTELLKALEDSKTVNMSYHAGDPQVGMGLTKNKDQFKMFVCDTGLFVTLAFWDKSFTENVIYEKLLADKLPANLGYVYENLVAQMLVAAGNEQETVMLPVYMVPFL